jgi:multicomponent Na+:H+ antiporter subunit E
MITFLAIFVGVFVLYILLVAGSGSGDTFLKQFLSWDEELIAAVILSLLAALIARMIISRGENKLIENPINLLIRPFVFVIYLFPWFVSLSIANLDVAYRVITGKIRPGIVRIKPGLETDLGRTILANSITLTPGTLTVDVDNKSGDLFVHWINVKEWKSEEEKIHGVCGSFADWARRIAE